MTTRRDTLDRLSKLAGQLNVETNGLTDKIKQVEKHLGRMRLGVTVWLEELIEDVAAKDGYVIGYTKLKDRWRIATKRVTARQDKGGGAPLEDVGDAKPLAKAPRLVRLRGIGQLDTLLSRLTDRVESFLAEVTRVKEVGEAASAKAEAAKAKAKAEAEEAKAKAKAEAEEAKAKAKAEAEAAKAKAKAEAEEAKAKAKAEAEAAKAKAKAEAEAAKAKAKAEAEAAKAKASKEEAKAKASKAEAKAKAKQAEAKADEAKAMADATDEAGAKAPAPAEAAQP